MKRFVTIGLILATGCGPAALKMDGPAADVKNNDGYQHVAQRLAASKAKWDTAEEKGNERLDVAKKYAGDREDTARHYTTERITKPLKHGDQENNHELDRRIDALEAKSDSQDEALAEELADLKAAQDLINELQDAAITLNSENITALHTALLALEAKLVAKDASLSEAIFELTQAMEDGDNELAAEIVAEIARVDGDIAYLAATHARDMRRVRRAVSRLYRMQRGLSSFVNYLSYRLRQLDRRVGYNSYQIGQLQSSYRYVLRKVSRLSRKVRRNKRNIRLLNQEVSSMETLLNNLVSEVLDLEEELEEHIEDEDDDEPCFPGFGGWPFCGGFPF